MFNRNNDSALKAASVLNMKKVTEIYKDLIGKGLYGQSLTLLLALVDKNMELMDAIQTYRRTIYTCHKKIQKYYKREETSRVFWLLKLSFSALNNLNSFLPYYIQDAAEEELRMQDT